MANKEWCVPCVPGAARDIAEKINLKIPPLIRGNLEGAPKMSEELIDCCRGGDLSRLGGDAFYPFAELVDHHKDELIAPCSTG